MKPKLFIGGADANSVAGRTLALAETVDRMFGANTAKNVTGGHLGSQGHAKLVAFLNEHAGIVSAAVNAPPPAVSVSITNPPAASATISKPTPTAGLSRAQLLGVLQKIEPGNRAVKDNWTDSEVKLETERAAYQAHVTFPGCRSESELSREFFRTELSGLNRAIAAEKQAAIKKLFKR